MPKCAFLSIDYQEGWFMDDELVKAPLAKLGWELDIVPWQSPTDWSQYDVVVIRSTWDYQEKIEEFLAVLSEIHNSETLLCNSLDLVEWNLDKRYLFELEQKGVQLVPTVFGESFSSEKIKIAHQAFKSDRLIIKPTISANADNTFILDKTEGVAPNLSSIFSERSYFLQPFLQQIVDEGEFSLHYFNGQYSHTILKTVAKGDFRVQEEHGGGVTAIPSPEKALKETADQVMKALSVNNLYARVDLVRMPDASFALMELELIEPSLYFRFDPESPVRFAKAIDEFYARKKS